MRSEKERHRRRARSDMRGAKHRAPLATWHLINHAKTRARDFLIRGLHNIKFPFKSERHRVLAFVYFLKRT